LLVFEEAVKAKAHVITTINLPGGEKIFFEYASDEQLDYVSPIRKMIYESFDTVLANGAEFNTRSLSGTDPESLARTGKASGPLTKTFMDRAANLDLRWCYTVFPMNASTQEADMSLHDYQEFVYGAG
jgi:aminopeptidase